MYCKIDGTVCINCIPICDERTPEKLGALFEDEERQCERLDSNDKMTFRRGNGDNFFENAMEWKTETLYSTQEEFLF